MKQRLTLQGEDGATLTFGYENRGDPYREGVEFSVDDPRNGKYVHVFVEEWEAKQLRDVLNKLYPVTP